MGRAGLPATRWQKWCDNGSQESLYFRLAHALSDAFRLNLPKDLKPLARWAAQIQYGEMSPGMAAVQAAELAWQQRLGELRVWGDHLVDPPRTCEELASAYLGFPF
jgi:hypothetical protein